MMDQCFSYSFSEDYDILRKLGPGFDLRVGSKDSFPAGSRLLIMVAHRQREMFCLISGMFLAREATFRVFYVRTLVREHAWELALDCERRFLEEARRRFGAQRYAWDYELASVGAKQSHHAPAPTLAHPCASEDTYTPLLEAIGLPWLRRRGREVLGRRVHISLSGFKGSSMLHNRESFSRESLEKNGFVVMPLADMDEAIGEKAKALLASPREDTKGLSPFVGEDEYDKDISFFLLEKTTRDVAGWAICRSWGTEAEIRRLFAASRFRRHNLGMRMGALILRILQDRSEGLSILALHSSESYASMHKLFQGYFSDFVDHETNLYRFLMVDEDAVKA